MIFAFLRSRRKQKGQALLEFALILPILLAVIFGLIYISVLFFSYVTLQAAVREGAYQIVTNGRYETPATITALVREKSFALSTVDVQITPPSATDWTTPRIRITVEAWFTVPFPTFEIPLLGDAKARMGPIRVSAKSNMTTE